MSVTRPRVLREVEVLARLHTVRAIQILAEIMSDADAPPGCRISAANSILDRGWGRAPQTVVVEDAPAAFDDSRLESEISDRIAAIAADVARNGEGRPEAGGTADGAAPATGKRKSSRLVH